jgi:hypothetical protein
MAAAVGLKSHYQTEDKFGFKKGGQSLMAVLIRIRNRLIPERDCLGRKNHSEVSMSNLTDEQAYAAMYYFLDQFYLRTKSDDVGGLLGSMSLLSDGSTADGAIALEWQEAVQFALKGGKAGALELKPSK